MDDRSEGHLDETLAERLASGASLADPVGGYTAPDVAVLATTIAGVPVRAYGSAPSSSAALVWVHGGGFSAGDLDMPESDTVARELAQRAGVTVIAVDYRLAAYPAGLDDVGAVLSALSASGAPLLLGGASAGGNLALAAALRSRDSGGPALAGLLLAYPYLHVTNPPASPELAARMDALPDAVRFGHAKMRAMAEFYLGARADDPPSHAYPGTADLAGLPPTLVIGAEFDDLLSSALDAADRLRAAGVPVDEYVESGVLHGHLNTPGLPGALRSLGVVERWLRARLA